MGRSYLIPGLAQTAGSFQYLGCIIRLVTSPGLNRFLTVLNNVLTGSYGKIKSPDPILIGVSFGMIAVKLAKQIQIILIHRITQTRGFRCISSLLGRTGIQNILPASPGETSESVIVLFFRYSNHLQGKEHCFSEILRDTDFAISEMGTPSDRSLEKWTYSWEWNLNHGSADRLFPNSQADITIPGGGHFMIAKQGSWNLSSTEANSLINELLPDDTKQF